MTVTGLVRCRNWAPAILMCLPRSAPIPCEWAPSPGSSALAYFDRAAVPVMTGLAARSSGAARRHQQRLSRGSRRVSQTLASPGNLASPAARLALLHRREPDEVAVSDGLSRGGRHCWPAGPADLAVAGFAKRRQSRGPGDVL